MEMELEESTSGSSPQENHIQSDLKLMHVYGWGNNVNGELGCGTSSEEYINTPTKLNFQESILSISCGENHTLLVTRNGLFSFGSNDHGQLGHNQPEKNIPHLVEGLEGRSVMAAASGYAHSLAIDKWGTLYAWGSDSHGQLGLGTTEDQDKLVSRPKVVKYLATKNVVQVSAGQFHSMILTNAGEVYTFGSNSHGQLGLGFANSSNQIKPCLVEALLGFPTALICSGGFHSFVLSISGTIMSWGKNTHGQLGISDVEDKCQPTQLSTLRSLNVRYIAAGSDHSVFLTKDGGVFTCGNSMYGQLGHNSTSNEVLPRKILEFGSIVTQIACGNRHTLCLTGNNKLYFFGLGTPGAKMVYIQINGLASIYEIYAGGDQSFALDAIHESNSPMEEDPGSHQFDFVNTPQILSVNYESISQMCSAVEPVDQDIMAMTEVLFASPACWNSSFLLSNNRHMPCTWKNNGLDLHEAEAVLSRLNSLRNSSLRDLVDHLLLSELLPKMPHQLQQVEILRVYVLLTLCPNFYNGTNQNLPLYYADRVQSLKPQMQNVIMRWLYNSPKEQIVRLISVYKRTILTVLQNQTNMKSRDKTLKTCLSFLGMLNFFNKSSLRLSYHTFTIPQLSSKVDIKLDYFSWLHNKGKPRSFFFCDYPFVFDAQAKTMLLQTDQCLQMQNAINNATSQHFSSMFMFPSLMAQNPEEIQYLLINVSRTSIVQDTINNLSQLNTHDLKKPLKVKFINEEAEDAGGVRKEFFMLLIREILDPKYGMFIHYEESRLIWFNENSFEENVMYFLIGLICGLAIYNNTIINIPFPVALYKKLLDEKVDLNDLKELQPSVGRSFEQLLEYEGNDFQNTFGLTFEITKESFGEMKTVPLKDGGANIPVTLENRAEFVELYLGYVLNVSVASRFTAFRQGFQRVCGSTVLPLFHPQELQSMVTGNEDYDWGELERNCTYKSVYSPQHPTIKMFWEVFHELELFEKKQFLLFLTGSDRIPILGMKTMKMSIQPTGDERFLPVSHTCFNLLDLPEYKTKERLKYKLMQAIQQNEGFSLV